MTRLNYFSLMQAQHGSPPLDVACHRFQSCGCRWCAGHRTYKAHVRAALAEELAHQQAQRANLRLREAVQRGTRVEDALPAIIRQQVAEGRRVWRKFEEIEGAHYYDTEEDT